MRCRLGNTAVKFGVLVFPNGRENADTTEYCFTAGPARTAFVYIAIDQLQGVHRNLRTNPVDPSSPLHNLTRTTTIIQILFHAY